MDTNRETEFRDKFRNILLELSTSEILLESKSKRADIYRRLEQLYYFEDNSIKFRHYYSDIFSVLALLKQDPSKGSIDILGQNLQQIYRGYQAINKDSKGNIIDISDNIKKLYDHASLDIARIQYSEKGDLAISGEESIRELRSKIANLNDIQKQLEEDLNKQQEEFKNQQKEYVSILGIFAAVVLAFTGGITFSTSVLNNIAQTNIYRIVIVSSLIGLVTINMLFALFYFINTLIGKERSIKPFLLSNIIFVLVLIATIIFWYFGFVEKRNTNIQESVSTPDYTTNISHIVK